MDDVRCVRGVCSDFDDAPARSRDAPLVLVPADDDDVVDTPWDLTFDALSSLTGGRPATDATPLTPAPAAAPDDVDDDAFLPPLTPLPCLSFRDEAPAEEFLCCSSCFDVVDAETLSVFDPDFRFSFSRLRRMR